MQFLVIVEPRKDYRKGWGILVMPVEARTKSAAIAKARSQSGVIAGTFVEDERFYKKAYAVPLRLDNVEIV